MKLEVPENPSAHLYKTSRRTTLINLDCPASEDENQDEDYAPACKRRVPPAAMHKSTAAAQAVRGFKVNVKPAVQASPALASAGAHTVKVEAECLTVQAGPAESVDEAVTAARGPAAALQVCSGSIMTNTFAQSGLKMRKLSGMRLSSGLSRIPEF